MADYLFFNPARPDQRSNYLLTTFASNYDDIARTSVENIIKQVGQKEIRDKESSKGIINKIAYYFHLSNPLEWIFLLLFSIVVTIFLVCLDKLITVGFTKRKLIASTDSSIFNFIFWVSSAVLFFILATSVGFFISPDADGSGVPEMKTVLSGVNKYNYFSFNAFIGKSLGLFAALVGGASVGKVGPFVHLSCLICNRIMKLNYFTKINKSTSTKTNMLSAACAAGITLALGSPLGGVLFSIESTASIYIVSNIWRSFFSAVICILFSKMINLDRMNIIEVRDGPEINLSFTLIHFIILGFATGALGASLSTLIAKGVYIRKKAKTIWLNSRFRFAGIVAVITSVTTFFIVPLQKADRTMMTFCYSVNSSSIPLLMHSNEGWKLILCLISKYIVTILGLVCTIPAGVFGPVFVIGAFLGKLYGHIMTKLIGTNYESVFALAASAGTFSGFSHTVSSALMLFEITGETSYLGPLLLTSLIANLVGQSLSMSIFDVLLAIKNLPHLPALKSKEAYSLSASDVMLKVDFYLEKNKVTFINALNILCNLPKNSYLHIPVVDNKSIIRYSIDSKNLYKYVFSSYEKIRSMYSIRDQSNFNEFFQYNKKKFFSSKRSFLEQIKYKMKKLYISIKDKERLILNKNFKQESAMRLVAIFKESEKNDKIFLGKQMDLNSKMLACDKSALTVDKNYPVLKIQFLFTFLNISHIFVTDNGQLDGIISKADFVKKTQSM